MLGSIFLVYWASSLAPGVFALPAGAGDVITGLLALPVAIALAWRAERARGTAIAWNIFCLLDFTVAISLGLITSPGPLQLIVPPSPTRQRGSTRPC